VGGGTKSNLLAAQIGQAVPSGWTATALAPDDWIGFDITGAITNITKLNVTLGCLRNIP
jgi:hypothetical protein